MSPPVAFTVRTTRRIQTVDITAEVRRAVRSSGIADGICVVFVPHTTAGVMVNENADPDVAADSETALARLVPKDAPQYRHAEGNTDSHVKAQLVGSSLTLIVGDGSPGLGTWQGVFLCEFDGPRTRTVHVKCVPG